jgi:hypothetical protein
MPSVAQRYELLLILQHNGVMQRLADLARVPKTEEAREYFSRFILKILADAWENDGLRDAALQLQSTNAALSRAARALRSAKQALANLDKRDREALWWRSLRWSPASTDFSNSCWAVLSRPDPRRIAEVDVRAQ